MDKKVIQALFANICAKDELRPIMNGVHFESERLYASDGHLLVIYNEGSSKFEGKTMAANGDAIEGRYPNVDSVFPPKENYGTHYPIDLKQLKEACAWHIKQSTSEDGDSVVIAGVAYRVKTLLALLNTLLVCDDASKFKFYNSDRDRATVIESRKAKALIMPTLYEEANVDSERVEGVPNPISYESFINDYVFNGWKKQPAKGAMDWLD